MEFIENVTMDDLKGMNIPTFNQCEHYLIKPHNGTMQTIVIELEGGKYLTVNINPKSDNVDVKLHGNHSYNSFGKNHTGNHLEGEQADIIHAFYNLKGDYNKK